MPGFDTDTVGGGGVLYATNVDFTGNSLTSGTRQVTANGQLLIGSVSMPNIRVGTITSPLGTLNIGYMAPNITMDLAGGGKSIEKVTGNDGVIVTPSVAGNINLLTANSTVKFAGTANTETLDFGLSNIILGSSAPAITSGVENVGIGLSSLNALTSGQNNTACGWTALQQITGSLDNCAFGNAALASLLVSTGSNTALGFSSLQALGTGNNNIAVGANSGGNYTGAESSNISIGNLGTTGESNVIRIGTNGSGAGQQNKAFIAGITGVTVAASAPIGVASTGQQSSLGFGTTGQLLTSTGNASSPTWQPAATFSQIVTQTFIATGTYTPTAGMKYCIIECVGAGGGGGGAAASATLSAAGGGGGGGLYVRTTFSAATIGVSQAVTIGAAGTAGANTGGTGGLGGTTSVGALISAAGGSGGVGSGAASATGQAAGGVGGNAGYTAGSFNSGGQGGSTAFWLSGLVIGGIGGSSGLGGGSPIQKVQLTTGTTVGNAGNFVGSGGGGAVMTLNASGSAGGAGGQGFVMVTEFI